MIEFHPKLYKVTLKGMAGANPISYGISYVVANDPTDAYNKVKEFLDEEDIGFESDRVLNCVELIADSYRFNSHGTLLFL